MVPQWLWGTLNGVTGFNVSDFHSDALYLASMPHNGEKHAKELDKQSHNLLECLVMQIDTKGYFVTSLYMVIKALYLINVFAQFFIINAIIGAGSQIWGLDAFWNMMKGESWEELGLFPRVTFCDYVVRHMGNTQRNTVQCVLMLNMFNEKIYMFLWFWLIFVMTVNITSFITNFKLLGSEKERIQMCEGWIDYTKIPEEHRRLSNKFVRNMLKADGALLFHFIQSKAGTAVTKELITGVFENYLDMIIPKIVKPLTSDDSGNEKEEKNDDVKSITSETEANSLIPKTPMDRFEVPKPDMDLSDVEEPSLDVKGMKIDPIL
ncbi:unnamed protein product, partial [Mesorhabditis spiculigera]